MIWEIVGFVRPVNKILLTVYASLALSPRMYYNNYRALDEAATSSGKAISPKVSTMPKSAHWVFHLFHISTHLGYPDSVSTLRRNPGVSS